jgi:hypothetical protein
MSQISISPWTDMYDADTNSVVKTTTNSILNGKLYAKVIGVLEGQAFQHMITCPHLWGNGILLLQELHQMYKPRCVPEVIAAKTAEFWGHTKKFSYETVDDYYNRFQELLADLEDAEEPILKKSAIRHFLFTLGSEFEPLQNNYRLGTIAEEWKTQDWPTLLVLCRDFYNSVNPKSPSKRGRESDSDNRMSEADSNAHHKKIKTWFLNPSRYKSELDAEQKKHHGKCIYHLSRSHTTENCHVKKECDATVAGRGSSNNPSSNSASTTGQLQHITEESFEDAIDDQVVDSSEDVPNNTNEDNLHYFSRVTNHYLHLAKSAPMVTPRHNVKFPIIADSGANFHMFRDIEFFETLAPVAGNVILGDGKTSVPIQGVGSIRLCLDGHILSVPDVRYVPSLAENIYSLFCHIQCPDHGVHSSFSEGLFLVFPNFRSKAILGENDIYVDAVPCVTTAVYSDSTNNGDSTVSLCRNMSQFQDEIQLESNKVDNLLASLCRYYKDIKTKRQLNLEVPAGFRQNNNFQRLLRDAQLYHLSQDISDCSSDDHIEEEILSDADK